MNFYVILIFAVFITILLVVRYLLHVNACKRISKNNPGKNIEGCPNWTLTSKCDDDSDDDSSSESPEKDESK